jgi:hypothetical protein
MRRAQQQTITFAATDSAGVPLTGLTFDPGELKISKDGGALANPTNAAAELGLGIYTLVITAAEANATWLHIAGRKSGVRAIDVVGAMDAQPAAAVVADAGNTATAFVTNLTESADGFWVGAGVVFTSGSLRGQVREIESYNGTTKAITLDEALTSAPNASDAFVLING